MLNLEETTQVLCDTVGFLWMYVQGTCNPKLICVDGYHCIIIRVDTQLQNNLNHCCNLYSTWKRRAQKSSHWHFTVLFFPLRLAPAQWSTVSQIIYKLFIFLSFSHAVLPFWYLGFILPASQNPPPILPSDLPSSSSVSTFHSYVERQLENACTHCWPGTTSRSFLGNLHGGRCIYSWSSHHLACFFWGKF